MNRHLCSFCEDNMSIGEIRPRLNICRVCRDQVLSYIGTLMLVTDKNPFVLMLCTDSHALPDAHWKYHDYVNQCGARVLRVAPRIFESKMAVDKTLDILNDL